MHDEGTWEDVKAGNRGQEKEWEECEGSGWIVQVNRAIFIIEEAKKILKLPFQTKIPLLIRYEKFCSHKSVKSVNDNISCSLSE